MMDWQDRVRFWIHEALQNEDVVDYEINFKGTTGKSEGYVGDIIFVDISGTDSRKKKKDVHLVIKQGKTNPLLREKFAIRVYFQREMFIYNEVLPVFTRFQVERNIESPFDCFPKCYKTMVYHDTEVVVLENCKPLGFELLGTKSMDLTHMKLVLKYFAKLHAISFALRDQNRSQFDNLTSNFDSTLVVITSDTSFRNVFRNGVSKVSRFLREKEENEVADKLEEKLNHKDPCIIIDEIMLSKVKESVILHGDNWINNFMFKYEGTDKHSPTNVCFLDWQLSSLHSPVLDLSWFFYAVSTEEEMKAFDYLMKYYHTHFSVFLRDLGCDPEKILPFTTLMTHWKLYGAFAAIWVVSTLDTMMCDEKDAPSSNDFAGGTGLGDMFLNPRISDEKMYKCRLIAIINHFCDL